MVGLQVARAKHTFFVPVYLALPLLPGPLLMRPSDELSRLILGVLAGALGPGETSAAWLATWLSILAPNG